MGPTISAGNSLKPARLALKCLLQGGNGLVAFCDGRFDRALWCAMNDVLADGMREVVLRLHNAQDCPGDRIAHVPLLEVALGVLDHEFVAVFVIHSHLPSFFPIIVCGGGCSYWRGLDH